MYKISSFQGYTITVVSRQANGYQGLTVRIGQSRHVVQNARDKIQSIPQVTNLLAKVARQQQEELELQQQQQKSEKERKE
jgi:hypothetical protein